MSRQEQSMAFAVNPVLLSAGAAVAALALNVLQGPEVAENEGVEKRPCGRCGGSGYVDCFCTKWDYSAASDGRRCGCDTCHGSLKEKCPKCNGSGGLRVNVMQPALIPAKINKGNGMRFSVAKFSVQN
mmetsp:Transcript_8467/g.25445  ORF Transcript_8467/g.25445 Transcript_8467/m.25445 type:complete len:128 (-) Transcript_8467:222-605(-)